MPHHDRPCLWSDTVSLPSSTVLLIDDSASDALLLHLAFEEVAPHVTLRVARDGHEAAQAVAAVARGEGAVPRLILLDLNLPGVSGFDILRQVKAEPVTAGVPVVVYTTDLPDADLERCAALGVQAHQVKPDGFGALLAFVRDLTGPWAAGEAQLA